MPQNIFEGYEKIQNIYGIEAYPSNSIKLPHAKIDPALVHKKRSENVLISHPTLLSKEHQIYRTLISPSLEHYFFFDHPLAHLPGMLIIEAARQFGTAISHIYYGAPFDAQFILDELSSVFVGAAHSDYEAFIDVVIHEKKLKNGVPRRLKGVGFVHQDNKIVARITSSWTIIPSKLISHIKFE